MSYSKNKSPVKNLPAGGVATSTGIDYQFRVAVWIATHILAEKDVSIPWELPASITLENIRLETEYPVDDILVGTSNSGRIFIQVKHSLNLEKGGDSDLASVLDQIVRQCLKNQTSTGDLTSARSFYSDRDRVLIIISPTSSSSISVTANSLLKHIRDQKHDLRIPEKEQQCLLILSNHIQRSWKSLLGTDPTEDEILQLLSFVYIFVLDVDHDGKDELNCKNLLRQSILKKADEVDAAWTTLLSKSAALARSRGGLDRNGLQRTLQDADIDLKITNSYREDVDRLKEYTSITFDSVSSLSKILVGSKELKVERVYASQIQLATASSHLLVVGEPGAGKSGALHDFVELLLKQEEDVIFVAIDRLSTSNFAEEIGLDNQFHKVLLNWTGIRPGFLVIDALDGARNEQTARQIQTLIEKVIKDIPRWHVVASVRKYDLRHHNGLKKLFNGKPVADFKDEEFTSIQHINIQDFSELELEQVRSQSHELSLLLDYKNPSLLTLLKKPFNLRLIGELIGEGVSLDTFTPIRTQVELLSKYWSHRVIQNDANGNARELVLKHIVEVMLKDHSMRVDRLSAITDGSMSQSLEELLRLHVLVEWQPSPNSKADRYNLAFSHNMLFDYALSTLIFNGNKTKLIRKLEEDHELVLSARPSIMYFFHDLWFKDQAHERFWEAAFDLIAANQIPLIGKLIGPSVAVDLARHSSDYDFVYSKLECNNQSENQLTYKIIQDTTSAILTFWPDGNIPNNQSLSLWAEFTERISRSMSNSIAYSVRAILMKLCEQPDFISLSQKKNLGIAARRLLKFAWFQEDNYYQSLVNQAITSVCRTYESNPIDSKTLIKYSLESRHLGKYGFEEMPQLAEEIKRLIINDPELSKEIYQKVFTHSEISEETTSMGGRILNLLSTKRQDFHMAQWRLAEEFQFFLEKAPIEAIQSLIDIIQYYVTERHSIREPIIENFALGEFEVTITPDDSVIWDSGSVYSIDEPVKMLNIFTEYLQHIASNLENIELLKQIVQIIIQQNRTAVFWTKLLIVASHSPASLGMLIRSLAWARPILIGADTTTAVGNFIRAIYEHLKQYEKIKLEKAILSIAQNIPENHSQEVAEHIRNRLLGCIIDKTLVLEETRKIVEFLKQNRAVPPNNPLFSIESWSADYTDEDFLTEHGVSLEKPEHKQILQLQKILKEFSDSYQNMPPTISISIEILPTLLNVENELNIKSDRIDSYIKNLAWGYLAQACKCIALIGNLDCKTELGKNIRRLLLKLANYPLPEPTPEQDAQFVKFQGWGSPAARIDAASGLVLIARASNCLDDEILKYLEILAKDPVPAVRFQIAVRLNVLLNAAPSLMWNLLQYYVSEEKNKGVIKGVMSPLRQLSGVYPDKVIQLVQTILLTTIGVKEDDALSQSCVSILLMLHLQRDYDEAGQWISVLLDNKASPISLLVHIVTGIRDVISDYKNETARLRAIKILNKLVLNCVGEFQQVQEHISVHGSTDGIIERLREIVNLTNSIVMTIYFSSGAFSEKNSHDARGKVLSQEEKLIFFEEINPAIKSLSLINYAGIIHHLVETLESLISVDPLNVFLLINDVVKSGKKDHYEYETLARDHVVKIIERYLAEYRLVIRESHECQQALLEILDIFVEAGWPNARKLTYRLEDIYR